MMQRKRIVKKRIWDAEVQEQQPNAAKRQHRNLQEETEQPNDAKELHNTRTLEAMTLHYGQ